MNFIPAVFLGLLVFTAGTGRAEPGISQAAPDRLSLEQALAHALNHNFSIRRARERLREQEGIVTTMTAAAWPTVTATGNWQKTDVRRLLYPVTGQPGVPLLMPSGQFWRMTFTGSQTLFAGGGVQAAIAAADLRREAAIFELQATVNDTLLDVRTRFYAVLFAWAQINVQEQNVRLLESQLQDVIACLQAGKVSEFERLRAEVALASAKVPLIMARNHHRLAVEELRQALGMEKTDDSAVGTSPDPIGTLTYLPLECDLRATLAQARERRPELRRLAKLEAAAAAGEQIAWADLYPRLTMIGGGELRKGPTNRFNDSLTGLRAGLQAQTRVNLRATTGRVRQAESAAAQARLAKEAEDLAVEVEVRQTVAALEQAAELVTATGKSVEQAEAAVRIAIVRFQSGISPQLDLLQSQVELTRARTNQLQSVYAHNVAIARLRKAVGVPEIDFGAVAEAGLSAPTGPK